MSKIIDTVNSLDLKNLEYECFKFYNNNCLFKKYNVANEEIYFTEIKPNLNFLELLIFPSFSFYLDDMSLKEITYATRNFLDYVSINQEKNITYISGEIYKNGEGCNCGAPDQDSIHNFVKQIIARKYDNNLKLISLKRFDISSRSKSLWLAPDNEKIISEVYENISEGIPGQIASLYSEDIILDIASENIIVIEYGWENSRPFFTVYLKHINNSCLGCGK